MTMVKIKDAGAIGVASDAVPQDLPDNGWSLARNMRFRDGCAERFLGHDAVFSAPSVTPYYLAPFQTPSKKYWIHAGLSAIYADDGITRSNITGTSPSGAIDDRWTGGTLNGVHVLNNGVDLPMYWGGAGTLATVPGWNATWKAASIRPFKNYLVALDVTKGGTRYPHMVKWSHAADPGTMPTSWNEADPAIDAGEVDLAETPDLLVDGMALGEMFIIYKQRSAYSMTFQGQPFIWRFQRLPGEYGMLARGCVANTPAGHVVLTAGDVVVHQGQGAKSILTGRMRRWLFTQMDSANYARSFVTANPWRNEAWICFPEAEQTSCTMALVWNWVDNTFGVRSLSGVTYGAPGQLGYEGTVNWSDGAAWESDTSGWNQNEFSAAEARLMLCTDEPSIVAVDIGATFSGENVDAVLERTGLAFDAPERVKTLRAIYPRIDAPVGTVVNIQVGAAMDAEANVTWGEPVPYTVGSTYKADVFASGRFLAVRISSTSVRPWRLRSYDLDIVMQGVY